MTILNNDAGTAILVTPLPKIMVAPNGARRNKTHHPALPMSSAEIVEAVIACQAAGADGAHLHIRNSAGEHLLNEEQYEDLLNLLRPKVPDMYLQVTSEAAGRYSADSQQQMVQALKPRYVSVGLREMVRDESDWLAAVNFYTWAAHNSVEIQHIVYSPRELQWFLTSVAEGKIPGNHHLMQFVLGAYDGSLKSDPTQIEGFTKLLDDTPGQLTFDWMLCAFGAEETDCLIEAIKCGGKARIGFENSIWNRDGTIAESNAERVTELIACLATI